MVKNNEKVMKNYKKKDEKVIKMVKDDDKR